jgi:hypothetical protein
MNDIILFFHFFGLMLGAAGGMGGSLVARRAASLPADQAPLLRALGPMMARVAHVGVALLWLTGLILVWSKWNGIGSLPTLFWVKFAFVVILTVVSILIEMTYADIRRGNRAVASRLPKLGPIAGISALLAVLFASLAFG